MSEISPKHRKAAILVSCLSEGEADALLSSLDHSDAAAIRALLVELEHIDPSEQERVLAEFLDEERPSADDPTDGVEMDLSPAGRIAASDDTPITEERPQVASAPTSRLEQVDCALLAKALWDEHPQTVAVVLAQQPAERASNLLVKLPLATQAEVVRRLKQIHLPSVAVVETINEAVVAKLAEQATRDAGQVAVTTWDEILDAASPDERERLLTRLTVNDAGDDPITTPDSSPAAPEVTSQEPTSEPDLTHLAFADLLDFDDVSLLRLLTGVDRQIILLALLGAPRPLVERLMSQLPDDEAQAFERTCESVGPVSLRDVEAAQQAIVQQATELAISGAITLPDALRVRLAA